MALVCKYKDCSKTFNGKYQRSRHHKRHIQKNDYFYKCCYCESSFTKFEHYKLHVEMSHPDEEKKIFKCKYPDCDVTFVLKQNRTIHYVDFHNQLTRKKTEELCTSHLTFLNFKLKQLPCKFCDAVFSTLIDLTAHTKKKHKKNLIEENETERKNEAESDQKPKKSKREPKSDQERNAPREKIYACTYDGCDKIYGRLNCLVRHYKTHDKVWVCRFCCEVFKTFFERAVHHKIHINKEQYQRRKEREREIHLLSIHNASNVMWRNLNGETSSLI